MAVWFFHTDLAGDFFYLLFGVVIASEHRQPSVFQLFIFEQAFTGCLLSCVEDSSLY